MNSKTALSVSIPLALSLAAGALLALFPDKTLIVLMPMAALVYMLLTNQLYEFLLIAQSLILILAQYLTSFILTLRWFSLFIILACSAFLGWKRKLTFHQTSIGLCVIGGYAILTSIFSYYPSVSFLRGVALVLMAGFLYFLPSAADRLHPGKKAGLFFADLFTWVVIIVVISNAIFTLVNPSASFMSGRYNGWFVNPNGLASTYSIFFLPVLCFEFFRQKATLNRIGLLFIYLLAAVELFASGSRAGMLAWFAATSIFFLGRVRWSLRITVIVIFVLAAIGSILVNPQNNPLRNFLYRNETTLQGSLRLSIWENVWHRFLQNPIFGTGLGVDATNASQSGLVFELVSFTTEKANSYLGMLQELGIVGTVLFIATLFIPILKAIWKGFLSVQAPNDLANLTFIAIVVAGLVDVFFEGWLFSIGSDIGYCFWIFASFLLEAERAR